MEFCEVLIAGGGAAGMACALQLARAGRRVILAERESRLGGVLNQCAHTGFGQGYFGREMTGIAYARAFEEPVLQLAAAKDSPLTVLTDTAVLRIDPDRSALLSCRKGLFRVRFDRFVLASGCRERSIHSQLVAGSRPEGILTGGMAQRRMNVSHLPVEDPVVILGTGDIGQIVARQLILNGQQVVCMIEQKDTAGGRAKNREQCIQAFHIPVLYHSTIVRICGEQRITGVVVRDLKSGQEQRISCRTLLTAIGLIPETELTDAYSARVGKDEDWIVQTGNCRYVHDIVDSVTIEAQRLSAGLFPAAGPAASGGGPAPENG